MALQVQELLVHAACNAPYQCLRVEVQNLCEFWHLVDRSGQLFRIRPNAVDRRADRERLTIAICDRAPMSRYFLRAQVARVRLLVEKVFAENLQINGTRD